MSPLKIEMIAKVFLENVPSLNEVLQILETFLNDNNYSKDYVIDNKDTKIIIIFKNAEVAFEFVKRINIEKLDNHIYSKLKTEMTFEPFRSHIDSTRQRTKRVPKLSPRRTMPEYEKPLEKKCLRKSQSASEYASIQASSPYLDQYEEYKKQVHENKKRWIINRNFNAYVGKRTLCRRENLNQFLYREPSTPFVFRQVQKKKWVSPQGFQV